MKGMSVKMSSDTLEKQIENLTAFLMQFYLPRGEGARRKKDFFASAWQADT